MSLPLVCSRRGVSTLRRRARIRIFVHIVIGRGLTERPGAAKRTIMANFTPVSAAIGGALIGLAAVLLMLLIGRIAGISGILAGTLGLDRSDEHWDLGWRLAFIAGLILAPLAFGLAGLAVPAPEMPASWLVIVAAGLLVGFGTRLGGGCTSGHGVCGIARLSPRSLVATAIFMGVAIAVVAIIRHGPGS
jgi:uncharacterized membrane protein YedE/YeeE